MPRKLLLTADHCSQYNLKTHYLEVVGGALLPAYVYCLKYEALPFVLDARHAGSAWPLLDRAHAPSCIFSQRVWQVPTGAAWLWPLRMVNRK